MAYTGSNNQGPSALVGMFASPAVTSGIGAIAGMFGPSYNPANGGEIMRQLQNGYNPPWSEAKKQAYVAWCQQYAPGVYNGTQSQWDGGYNLPNSSKWGDRYDELGGAAMDGSGNPTGGPGAGGGAQGGPAKNLTPPGAPPQGAPPEWAEMSGLQRMWWKLKTGKAAWYEYAGAALALLVALWLLYRLLRMLLPGMFRKMKARRGKRKAARAAKRSRRM